MCNLEIHGDHFRGGNFDHYKGMNWRQVPWGDAYGYVGCGANMMNDNLGRLPNSVGIPGMPRNHFPVEDVTPEERRLMDQFGVPYDDEVSSDEIPDFLDQAFASAKSLAQSRCSKGYCCQQIKISVICGDEMSQDEKDWRKSGVNKCGKSTVYDCGSKSWSMLH